jgi:hypothetical protein
MAQMTDCSTKKDPKERMDCIEKNVVTLNSAFETVTKELRNRLTELESALAKLEKGVLKPGDAVTLSSFDPTQGQNRGQCLTYIDHDRPPNIQACGGGAAYAQSWILGK